VDVVEPPPLHIDPRGWEPGAIKENRSMAKQIICQCGFVARGENLDEVLRVIESHMQSHHPELVGEVSRQDLLGMAEET
jgi:predicted small metal-binding protein